MADSSVNFSGVASGIDTASLIKALVDAKSQPLRVLQSQASGYQGTLTRMNDLGSKLSALSTAALSLANASSFAAFSSTSSDTTVLGVTASSTASEGHHSVTVQQLATGQTTKGAFTVGGVSQTVASSDSAMGLSGTLTFTPYGDAGVSVPLNTVTVDAGDSLAKIRDKINNSAPTAFGSVSFSAVPKDGTTLTLDGKTYEFSSTGSVASGNVAVNTAGAATGADAAALLVAAKASTGVSMSASGGTVTLQATTAGSGGNLIGMSEKGDDTGAIALSGSTLSGGLPQYNASIINTGTSSAPSWSLVLTGRAMGASSAFTASFAPSGGSGSLAFSNIKNAQDSILDVDGITGIHRSSNLVSDVVNGVTMNLVSAPTDKPEISLTVVKDNTAIRDKVNSFITAYNAVASYIHENASYDVSTKTAGPLLGDATVSSVSTALQAIAINRVSGLTSNFSALSRVGITTQADGTLKMDNAKFDAALSSDFRGVADLFSYNLSTGTKGVGQMVYEKVNRWMSPVDGLLSNRKTALQGRIDSINTMVSQKQAAIDLYETSLKTKYANMEKLVSALKDQSNALASLR